MGQRSDSSQLSSYTLRVLIAAGIGALTVTLLVMVWFGLRVVLIIFAGILLGLFLLVPVGWLSKHTFLSPRWALLIALLGIIGLVSVFGFTFATRLNEQFQLLIDALPNSLAAFREQVRSWPLGGQVIDRFQQGGAGGNVLEQWLSRVSSVLSSTMGALVNLFFVTFLALFIAFEPETYRRGLLRLVPPARRPAVKEFMASARYKLNWWMLGRLLSMTVIGVITGLGLWLIGMPMYLSLAVLAAVLVFIPYLGPILAAAPALLIGLSEGLFLQVAALYVLLQGVESYLITPMVDRESVKLPPALLLSAQVVLGLAAGAVGLLLAAPITVLAMIFVEQVYLEKWLKEGSSTVE